MDNVVKLPTVEQSPVRTLRSASEAFLAGIANAGSVAKIGGSQR